MADGIWVESQAEAWGVRDWEHSVGVELPGDLDDIVDEGRAVEIFHEVGFWESGSELEIGGEADGGIPTMGNELGVELFGHVSDTTFFADAAALGDVGLDNIEGAGLEPGLEGLAAGQDFSAGNGNAGILAQEDEIIEGIGMERFLEPGDLIISEHFRSAQSPFVVVGPESVAAAGIDHEEAVGSDGVASGADDRFVESGILSAERAPADFEGAKALGADALKMVNERLRSLHKNGGVWLDAVAVTAAEEASDWLARGLAEDIPESDVDSADGVSESSTASEPKGVLMEFFRDAFGFESIFAQEQGFEQCEGGFDELVVGEDAAPAGQAFVGMHCNEGMNTIVGFEFVGPAAFGSCAPEAGGSDLADFHGS